MKVSAVAATAPAAIVSAQGAADIPALFASILTAHDIDAFAALFSPDYMNHQFSAANARPPLGTKAKEVAIGLYRSRLVGMPDLKVTVEKSLLTIDSCAASFLYEGTHKALCMNVPPTGKRVRFSSCDIFRISNGLIVERWGMGEIAGLMAQLKG
nr:ester cyclase [Paraburkholderia sp. Ac-20347]